MTYVRRNHYCRATDKCCLNEINNEYGYCIHCWPRHRPADFVEPPEATPLPRPGLTFNAMAAGSLVIGLLGGAGGTATVLWLRGML